MQQQQQQPSQPSQSSHGPALTNIDPVLEGAINKFVRSEKYARKIKYIVRGTSVPGRQNYKFAPATALTPQETRIWRQNLMQDEIASNNPFWTARWMRVFGVAPKLDDSLLKVPWVKCERTKAPEGDVRAALPLHRKETYLDLRDDQNRNWAMDSYTMGIQCAQNGELENALKAYSQSIQIDSKSVDAYIARGCTLANMSKFKEAIMDFRQAITLQPSNDQARSYLDSTIAQEEHMRLNATKTLIVTSPANVNENGIGVKETGREAEIAVEVAAQKGTEAGAGAETGTGAGTETAVHETVTIQDHLNATTHDNVRQGYDPAQALDLMVSRELDGDHEDSDKEPSGEEARCQESNTGSVEKSCQGSTQNSLTEALKESCASHTTSIQDSLTETLKESCTSYTTSIQVSLAETLKESCASYTTSIQSSTVDTASSQESQKAVKESSTADATSIQESQKAKRLSTRDSKNENDAKNPKNSKDTKDTKDPRDFQEDKVNKDSNLASKVSEASSSKKVESTDDTVYFMRANIDAQKELKTDVKDGKDTTNTKDATKDSKETKDKDNKDGSKRPMEDSRRDEDSKRPRTRSPEHHRRSPHHNNHNHRDRSRSRSRSETRDDSKSGGRRRPLPSQSDLRRAQASGSGGGGGVGGGGSANNRNRGRRNRTRSPKRSSK
ncbi:hypothetical protein BG005_011164 [Podila minutissima]|nr:hypothetical protein BG005_011164 [Podila minutissima]